MIFILVILGNWQIERLQWKNSLIANIKEGKLAEAVNLPLQIESMSKLSYRQVNISGQFYNNHELFLVSKVRRGRVGLNVITPFKRIDTGKFILVNRGWAPLNYRLKNRLPNSLEGGFTTISGIFRIPGKKNYFIPDNEPDKNMWFFIDIDAMSRATKIGEFEKFYLSIEESGQSSYPVGNEVNFDPLNHHLGYALIWYSLAVSSLFIYILMSIKRRN